MGMVLGTQHLPALLPANDRVRHPRVVQDIGHRSARLGIELQHPPNDMPALPRKQPQDAPRAANHLLLFRCRGLRVAVLARGWS